MQVITTAKKVVPRPLKEVVRGGLRAYGTATGGLRPLPDFLIVGTKRGGTTSLWNYLLTHPQVVPMLPAAENLKSPHYFYWHYDRGEGWYRGHFPTRRRRQRIERGLGLPTVTGEASPYYLYSPHVPRRVAEAMPHVKVVAMLRNPVTRAYSHYWERVNEGAEPLSFAQALAAEPRRLAGEMERIQAEPLYYSRAHDWHTYRDRGIYRPQVERWYAHLPEDQVLLIRSEDFYAEPQKMFDVVTDFLGLERVTLERAERMNSHAPDDGIPPEVYEELADFYRPYNAALAELVGRDFGWD